MGQTSPSSHQTSSTSALPSFTSPEGSLLPSQPHNVTYRQSLTNLHGPPYGLRDNQGQPTGGIPVASSAREGRLVALLCSWFKYLLEEIRDVVRALWGWRILTLRWDRVLLFFSNIPKPSPDPPQHNDPERPANPPSEPRPTGASTIAHNNKDCGNTHNYITTHNVAIKNYSVHAERPVNSPSEPPQHTDPERPVNPSSDPTPPGPAGSGPGGSTGGGIGNSHNRRVRNYGTHSVNRRPIMTFGAHSRHCGNVDKSHNGRTVHTGGVRNYGAHGVNNWENATFN